VTSKQKDGWKKVVESVHNQGGKIILQLMHAGALSQHLDDTRGPSAIKPLRTMLQGYSTRQGEFLMPISMSKSEIGRAVDGFVASAFHAEEAGFDGVEIHGANGYLLDQFLTSYTNQREDQYGGSVKNRVSLITEIIKAICDVVNPNFLVGVRLSQGKVNDFNYKWPGGLADGKIIFSEIKNTGADYIHFASEGAGFDHGCLTVNGESLTRQARDLTGLPIIANGGLHETGEAERILRDGHGDLIALGTGALANPDWPRRLHMGHKIEKFDPKFFENGVTLDAQPVLSLPSLSLSKQVCEN
jgi:2,4-dienoyl-CoA reductase-like NADH-dependent reductase (Old Yellow Enzyme family)